MKLSHAQQIRRVSFIVFASNSVATMLNLVSAVLITHWLGPAHFGLYSFVIAVMGIIGVIGALGLPTFIIRQMAVLKAESKWMEIKGLLLYSSMVGLISCGLIALGVMLGFHSGKMSHVVGFHTALFLAMVLMILNVQGGILTSALQGLDHIVRSVIPGTLGMPVLYLCIISLVHWANYSISVTNILIFQVTLALLFVFVQFIQVIKILPRQLWRQPMKIQSSWIVHALPFLVNGVLTVVNLRVDVFLLGILKNPQMAGIYNASSRGALLLVMALGAIATSSQPLMASLYAKEEVSNLRRVVTMTSRYGTILSAVGALILILFRHSLLTALFGQAFAAGGGALVILSLSRVLNASVGSLGPFLAMTNRAKILSVSLGCEAGLNVCLNCLLIPKFGMDGSSLATGGSMSLINICVAIWIFYRTGYDVSFLGLHKSVNDNSPAMGGGSHHG